MLTRMARLLTRMARMARILYTLGWFSLDSWLVIDSFLLLARETAKKNVFHTHQYS